MKSALSILHLHEEFHHKHESFAIKLEVTARRRQYVTYSHNVYSVLCTRKSEDLIEEQLATSESFSRLNEAPYKRGVPDEVRGPLPGFRRAWIPTLPPATTRRSRR